MKTYTLDDYEITKDGKVINKHSGKEVKPQPNGKGYLRVSIGKKRVFVHRLVATLYIPNPNNLAQVNHIDGDKRNNSVSNLEWVDNLQNRQHAVKNGLHLSGEKSKDSKLKRCEVDEIRAIGKTMTPSEIAKRYGVSRQTINDILKYRTWKQ